jgi:hypothetical protein
METNTVQPTLGEMFARLSRETQTLVQQELQLAKTELTEKASKMGKGAGLVVGGGLLAYAGLLAIIAGAALVLVAIGLPSWAAAIIVGLAVAAVGYLLVRSGLSALNPQGLTPRKTIETLKEDAQWLKAQVK